MNPPTTCPLGPEMPNDIGRGTCAVSICTSNQPILKINSNCHWQHHLHYQVKNGGSSVQVRRSKWSWNSSVAQAHRLARWSRGRHVPSVSRKGVGEKGGGGMDRRENCSRFLIQLVRLVLKML
ncbi:hypothetical protein CEXT_607881 [Caerostris extrusa]|uniref:Uncharacterized protein n=1 Tax=Caerostris extrusa TaxID=172846 RepID=A0AAV4MVM5_CAEEX|nr:hypothetical protein CEXT_607881 [Caerostris extrusa]